MPSAAPTATVKIAGQDRTVVFNMATLFSIEDATGRTVTDIALGELAKLAREDGREPTQAEKLAMLRQLSAKFVGQFVAGCLGVRIDELERSVPMGGLMEVFTGLAPAFVEAVVLLNGGDPEAEGGAEGNPPAEAPAASGS